MAEHFINLAPGGVFRKTGQFATGPADVDAIVAAVEASHGQPVVLHFHGGLVSEAHGMRVAHSMERLYAGVAYPVTFVWETGALDILRANLDTVWSTKLFQTLLRMGIKYAAKKLGVAPDGSRSIGGSELSPAEVDAVIFDGAVAAKIDAGARGAARSLREEDLPTVEAELEAELAADVEVQRDAVLAALDEARAQTPIPLAPDLVPAPPAPGGKGGGALLGIASFFAKIAFAVIKRFVRKRDHGLYPTVIEEVLRAAYLADLGRWGWDAMKSSASGMWADNQPGPDPATLAGGSYLVDRLRSLPKPPIIDLVGHSAGAIAICHMLDSLRQRGVSLPVRNVTLLAPACRQDLFLTTIALAVQEKRVRTLRMFTMSDAQERQDPLVDAIPLLYPSSLLYLVSGAFENEADAPILGMERFLGDGPPFVGVPFDDLRKFFTNDRLVVSPTDLAAVLGRRSAAIDHGSFDEDVLTRESLLNIVQS